MGNSRMNQLNLNRLSQLTLFLALALLETWSIGAAFADTLTVMSSGGYTAALEKLVPQFEQQTGHKVNIVLGPSMGTSPEAIPVRLERGEKADILFMVGSAIAPLGEKKLVFLETKKDLARSKIAMAVKEGAPKPDISTVDALKSVLVKSKSIAYSDSASGVYIEKEMYKKLGLEAELKSKSKMIVAERVGNVVARGDAEIGFQQVSELLPVRGITFVGTIPDEVQKITFFSAVITQNTSNKELANNFLSFLTQPSSRKIVEDTGLEAIAP
jgi:molybdate transport system substrate-binding protein